MGIRGIGHKADLIKFAFSEWDLKAGPQTKKSNACPPRFYNEKEHE